MCLQFAQRLIGRKGQTVQCSHAQSKVCEWLEPCDCAKEHEYNAKVCQVACDYYPEATCIPIVTDAEVVANINTLIESFELEACRQHTNEHLIQVLEERGYQVSKKE